MEGIFSWRLAGGTPAGDDSAGAVIVECALGIVLLIWIPFAAFELGRVLQVTQTASVLAREAGSQIFRSCADFREPRDSGLQKTMARTAACIDRLLTGNQQSGVQAFADSLEPPGMISIIISVYGSGSGGEPVLLARLGERPAGETISNSEGGGAVTTAPRLSRFRPGEAGLEGPAVIPAEDLRRLERITIAEVYYRYNPFLISIPVLGASLTEEGDYYDLAIF